MADQLITNPLVSLHETIVFDSRDWGLNSKDAWIYGIVVGWNAETPEEQENLFQEFNRKFKWTRETWNRLNLLHNKYLTAKQLSY